MKRNNRFHLKPQRQQSKMTSRADLVAWMASNAGATTDLEAVAGLAGFSLLETPLLAQTIMKPVMPPSEQVESDEAALTSLNSAELKPPNKITTNWLFLTERRSLMEETAENRSSESSSVEPEAHLPPSIRGIPDFTPADLKPGTTPSPPLQPLLRWPRLWPVLKQRLSRPQSGGVDLDALMRQVAEGEWVNRFPRQQRAQWPAKLIVLLDFNPQVLPFWDDFNQLCDQLIGLQGPQRLDIRQWVDRPGQGYLDRQHPEREEQLWRMPAAGAPLLICSDLGLLSRSENQQNAWLQFGKRLKRCGVRPFVLAPLSASQLNPALTPYYQIALWDRSSHLLPQQVEEWAVASDSLKRLLTLLSPAIRIEPELLRAVRHSLAETVFDAGLEAACWQHPDMTFSPLACSFRVDSEQQVARLNVFQDLFSKEPPALQQQVLRLIQAHHGALFPAILHEEVLIWSTLVAEATKKPFAAEIAVAKQFFQQMARMFYQQSQARGQGLSESQQDYGRRYLGRSSEVLRDTYPVCRVVEGIVYREALEQGTHAILPGQHQAELQHLLTTPTNQERTASLIQKAGLLLVVEKAKNYPPGCAPLFDFTFSNEGFFIQQTLVAGEQVEHYYPWQRVVAGKVIQPLRALAALRLQTEREMVHWQNLPKPNWATQVGCDAQGLWVEFVQQEKKWQIYWPQWSHAVGWDEAHGLYADLIVKEVVQRCRWLPPGRFLMGSPASEKERRSNEQQHSVTLREGFWLADTACTQSFWHAVMGENPARFTNSQDNPVEQVSWQDVQVFMAKLNRCLPGLKATLPTEAQWEYACRAGTTTPFSFGQQMTPEQVNYDGNVPYADGKKGVYREKTVPVQSLPANAWGLYEMHGNVLEWCSDCYVAEYAERETVDSTGSAVTDETKDALRVLRGGSWFLYGWYVRSANRRRSAPDGRSDFIGFRFSPGQAACRVAAPHQNRASSEQRDAVLGQRRAAPAQNRVVSAGITGWQKFLKRIRGQ